MWLCHVCDSVCVTACVTAYLTNPNDAVGTCQKGAKCKFSHDMSLANKSEKRSLYTTEEDGKAEGKFIFLKAGTDYCYPTFAVPSGTWWYLVVLGGTWCSGTWQYGNNSQYLPLWAGTWTNSITLRRTSVGGSTPGTNIQAPYLSLNS